MTKKFLNCGLLILFLMAFGSIIFRAGWDGDAAFAASDATFLSRNASWESCKSY